MKVCFIVMLKIKSKLIRAFHIILNIVIGLIDKRLLNKQKCFITSKR